MSGLFTVLIASYDHIDAIQQRNKLFFEPFLESKELALWPAELGIAKEAESFADYTDWYVSANSGMGACLVMAEEMDAYILTDKATFLTFVANNGQM